MCNVVSESSKSIPIQIRMSFLDVAGQFVQSQSYEPWALQRCPCAQVSPLILHENTFALTHNFPQQRQLINDEPQAFAIQPPLAELSA